MCHRVLSSIVFREKKWNSGQPVHGQLAGGPLRHDGDGRDLPAIIAFVEVARPAVAIKQFGLGVSISGKIITSPQSQPF